MGPNRPAKTETIDSFLDRFNAVSVFKAETDNNASLANDAIDLKASLNDAEASPVVALFDRILVQAISVSTSDIHLEPQQRGLRLRYRQEGVLLSTSLIRQKVLPDMAPNMLAIGEETEVMDKMLSKVADFFEDEVSAFTMPPTSIL